MKYLNILLIPICLLFSSIVSAQGSMKPIAELINLKDPAWPLIQQWIRDAKNKIEVLEIDSTKASQVLYDTQVSTYATLGSVIYYTGGIMVDHGWIRILGSGHPKLNRSVSDWNLGKTIKRYGDQPDYLLVADDAAGGFFAINYGAFGSDLKNIYYLAPNSLVWEPLNFGYSEFVLFCFDGNLSDFYRGLRWSTWNQFIDDLDGNKSYSFRPYLWAKEGTDINSCSRKLVSTEELFKFNIAKQKELGKKSTAQ